MTGSEAARFLHNLTTQDVINLPAGEGREGFAVTAKARVVAYFLISHVNTPRGGSTYWLNLPPGTADKTIKHFDHFRISEQVEFADRTHDFAQFHHRGAARRGRAGTDGRRPIAAPERDETIRPLCPSVNSVYHSPTRPLGLPGFDVICPTAALGTRYGNE